MIISDLQNCVNKWNNKREKTEQQVPQNPLPETVWRLPLHRCANHAPLEKDKKNTIYYIVE